MTGCATRLTDGSTLKSKKITINKLKCRGTIWDYTTCGDGSKLKHKHPATFPDMMPYDFIECFCPPNGVVLDPFVGSGTTMTKAQELNRDSVGIDLNPSSIKLVKGEDRMGQYIHQKDVYNNPKATLKIIQKFLKK